MNLTVPASGEFGLRERLRSAESRLRAADALASAARTCVTAAGWTELRELEAALEGYEHPRLLGAPGHLLTDHRLIAARTATLEAGSDPGSPVTPGGEIARLSLSAKDAA